MRPRPQPLDRRRFLGQCGSAAALGALATGSTAARADDPVAPPPGRTKVAVVGCGSVSRMYLPHLSRSPFVELVAVADRKPERAAKAAADFGIAAHFPSLDALLAGPAFDLLVNLTDMQEHEHLNRQALEAKRHVWSEKPLANSSEAGRALLDLARANGVRIWGAPTVVNSPQFAFMARALAQGVLGRPAAAHAAYGHLGPDWSAFFYESGGGSLPDLGVYNLTFLTGLLGPAKAVMAMTSIVTPRRTVQDKGDIQVEAEDNAMVLLDHGDGVLSHVQCGFNYYDPHGHGGQRQTRPTLWVTGTGGSMALIGYDWEPRSVVVATPDDPEPSTFATDVDDYVWQQGASVVAECLATGREPRFTPEHALHVLEIIEAARTSQAEGRRVDLKTTFERPKVPLEPAPG